MRIKALEGRDGHEEVAPHISHQAFDLSFVVALAGTPEPVLEEVVGLKLGKGTGALTSAVTQYPGHGQPGIVVEDALRALRPGM